MNIDRPEPGSALNPAAQLDPALASTARPAAAVILVRGEAKLIEVLLVRRNPGARVMGGIWVFPGGTVDPAEGDGEIAFRAAALRELREEAGITLDPDAELVAFARWITPLELKVRFDTCFYLAAAPPVAEIEVDGAEVVDYRWVSPAEALEAAASGQLQLVFPTIRQLQELSRFASAADLFAHARGREVVPVQPRVIDAGGSPRIVLPGEPGTSDASPLGRS